MKKTIPLVLLIALGACRKKEVEPDSLPKQVAYKTYSIRFTWQSPATNPVSKVYPCGLLDIAPYDSPYGSVMNDHDVAFGSPWVGFNSPAVMGVRERFSYKGKQARLLVSFLYPRVSNQIQPGDRVFAQLLGDTTVLAKVSMDYHDATTYAVPGVFYSTEGVGNDVIMISKSVEFVIP